MEPMFVEQQRQFEQLLVSFQYLDEDTRKTLSASGAKSIPPQVVDLLSQVRPLFPHAVVVLAVFVVYCFPLLSSSKHLGRCPRGSKRVVLG